jgi:hypothetical protein
MEGRLRRVISTQGASRAQQIDQVVVDLAIRSAVERERVAQRRKLEHGRACFRQLTAALASTGQALGKVKELLEETEREWLTRHAADAAPCSPGPTPIARGSGECLVPSFRWHCPVFRGLMARLGFMVTSGKAARPCNRPAHFGRRGKGDDPILSWEPVLSEAEGTPWGQQDHQWDHDQVPLRWPKSGAGTQRQQRGHRQHADRRQH